MIVDLRGAVAYVSGEDAFKILGDWGREDVIAARKQSNHIATPSGPMWSLNEMLAILKATENEIQELEMSG